MVNRKAEIREAKRGYQQEERARRQRAKVKRNERK
jgi:hypothetical protein